MAIKDQRPSQTENQFSVVFFFKLHMKAITFYISFSINYFFHLYFYHYNFRNGLEWRCLEWRCLEHCSVNIDSANEAQENPKPLRKSLHSS